MPEPIAAPPADPPAPPPTEPGRVSLPPTDIEARIVNGILVLSVIAVVGLLYAFKPSDPSMFGAFTTLVGTALSAYFGISATREISRNATDSANQRTSDAREHLAQVQTHRDALASKLTSAQTVLSQAQTPANDNTLAQVRSILAS
jgi:hypothetical protein